MLKIAFFLYLIVQTSSFGVVQQHPSFDPMSQPWLREETPIIIDAYGPNRIDWEQLKTDRRVTAIIHKASQGLKTDELYAERHTIALESGYLWGSYHLGVAGDPIEQAEHYLSVVGSSDKDLLSLDLEDVNDPKFMSLENAILFIEHLHSKTGRYPVVYCNKNVLSQINSTYGDSSVFSKCPLWYARFRKEIPDWESVTWESYTLWQFSSEINCQKTGDCLYNAPGCAFDMDINVYNGSFRELTEKWPNL